MKFRVERDALADAVTWAARSLASRPTLPVLAGLMLSVDGDQLSVSGFDLEASTEVDLVLSTPGLSDDDRIAILGGTAQKLMGIKP